MAQQLEGWATVGPASHKRVHKKKTTATTNGATSREAAVRQFLAVYKTRRCLIEEHHDKKLCTNYHDESDMRRDPFEEFYLPENANNQVEIMYHPANFRTVICRRGPQDCPFKKNCSFAHTKGEMRDHQISAGEYELTPVARRSLPSLGSAVSKKLSSNSKMSSTLANSQTSLSGYSSTIQQVPGSCFHTTEVLSLVPHTIPWFMVHYPPFFNMLREKALEQGLSQVTEPGPLKKYGNQEHGILITGPSSDVLLAKFTSLLLMTPPRRFFVLVERAYGTRVVTKLSKLISGAEGQGALLGHLSNSAFLEIDSESIRVCAKNGGLFKGNAIVKLVFEKIDFWVKQSGYDAFLECLVCCEPRNRDEGVTCISGHFFCSAADGSANTTCVATMVKSQIPSLAANHACITCGVCKEVIEMQTLANHLEPQDWKEVNSAVLDAKVKHTEETLAKQFDQRLEDHIQDFMERYESTDARVKMKAELVAKRARNEALNLKCPHCKAVYAEFDGCMALKCAICHGNFCGYCHHPVSTSQGAHEHVRDCNDNESSNGSYFASKDEIKRGQRKYRTKQLRKFLRQHKKEIQNATIIELQKDLADLDIDPAALFEFGNLMPEL
ncbi:expressed unknown protein [Seminavis robusta]|uniref:C3H1-type domain-containing protein n=1 Tax=Seminavis robusta TaxID=568900 RepID=A0A9N8EX99_9STRA|nr:expressed unknown protein [Seminavis robusta]|eukprot:Sro2323_g323310.1 n/a (611) ;mRNA; r:9367-11199